MKEFGAVLLLLGILGIFYFQYGFDTSINIESGKNAYSKPYNPGERDNQNVGLIQDKNNYTYLSVGVTVIGAVLFTSGFLKRRNKHRF
jgi:hypothetical protein